MTTTIQAQVSSSTLSKVSRLFNASLTDCLNELLQNARRAGASAVKITLLGQRRRNSKKPRQEWVCAVTLGMTFLAQPRAHLGGGV
jgi:hypothetical protein